MKFEEYISGHKINQGSYKSFQPAPINSPWSWDEQYINVLLEEANQKIGELNAFSKFVPDVDLYIKMHVIKEANTSSMIEGTKTRMDEVLIQNIDKIDPEKRDDWQEVQNYIEAMDFGIKELNSLPLSNRLIRNVHRILLQGVRGENKLPGEFRKSQNWIGGSSPSNAFYVPPVHTSVPELMGDLEKFFHNEDIFVPHLIRIAISHYQFETIHPFLDGNGRVGRLLIPLYLITKGLLLKPSLYISDYFEKNKQEYYDALTQVRENNNLNNWVSFFLKAVIETCEKGVLTFQGILSLEKEINIFAAELGKRSGSAYKLKQLMFKKIIFNGQDVTNELGITKRPANELIAMFEEKGFVKEVTGQQRYKRYLFKSYYDLFL